MTKLARVGVTGANGFVGRQLVSSLADRGFRTTAIARHPYDVPEGALWVQSPSLDAAADWSRSVDGLDVLIHCAGRAHILNDTASDPAAAFEGINAEGTAQLARQAAARNVRRFVFLSSIKVNGESTLPGHPYTADDQPAPRDAYGASKLNGERALFAIGAQTGMEIVVIRPPLIYGPGVSANFYSLMKAIALGIPMPFGSIRNERSLLFLGNLVDLILCTIDHPAAAGQVFLARDGCDLSTSELTKRLATALEKRVRSLNIPAAALWALATLLGKRLLAQRTLCSLAVDDTATRRRLGWSPPFTIAQGLSVTAHAFRAEQLKARSR